MPLPKRSDDGQKSHVRISIDGCDDSTVIEMEVTAAELTFLNRVAEAVNSASSYQCMPTIKLKRNDKEAQADG